MSPTITASPGSRGGRRLEQLQAAGRQLAQEPLQAGDRLLEFRDALRVRLFGAAVGARTVAGGLSSSRSLFGPVARGRGSHRGGQRLAEILCCSLFGLRPHADAGLPSGSPAAADPPAPLRRSARNKPRARP